MPVAKVPEFLKRADEAVEKLIPGTRPVPFGHMGDGNIHYNVSQPVGMDRNAFLMRWYDVNDVVHQVVNDLGGSISAEHGIGVGAAVDMGDAVVVPRDGDPGRFRLPAGSVALAVCRCRKGTARQRHPRPCAQQAQNPDILHSTVSPSAGRQLSACAV